MIALKYLLTNLFIDQLYASDKLHFMKIGMYVGLFIDLPSVSGSVHLAHSPFKNH